MFLPLPPHPSPPGALGAVHTFITTLPSGADEYDLGAHLQSHTVMETVWGESKALDPNRPEFGCRFLPSY